MWAVLAMTLNGLQTWWATERLRSAPGYFTPYSVVVVSGPFGAAFVFLPPLLLIATWIVARYYRKT